jgi:predicted regulator of Ras-like GTPase activity (Roadblock/LC7/MglB family)
MNAPIGDNEALRYRRLAFYARDVEQFNAALDAFLEKAHALCALLIDVEGHMVAKRGFLQRFDSSALAALVAGSFASTRQVASLLGESQFNVQNHQGRDHTINITLVGSRTLQVTMFNATAKAGMISLMTRELANRIDAVLADIAQRQPGEQEEEQLSGSFSDEAKDQLDNLFGDL